MGVTKPSLILLILQQVEKSLEMSTSLKTKRFWKTLALIPWDNFIQSRNLHENSLLYTIFYLFHNSSHIQDFEARWNRESSDIAAMYLKN